MKNAARYPFVFLNRIYAIAAYSPRINYRREDRKSNQRHYTSAIFDYSALCVSVFLFDVCQSNIYIKYQNSRCYCCAVGALHCHSQRLTNDDYNCTVFQMKQEFACFSHFSLSTQNI